MKKILISAKNLKIGGIEKSLINLVNELLEQKYKITLVLEERKGELLPEVKERVKIIKYSPCKSKFKLFRKTINLIKRVKFIIRYGRRFNTSISFATYSKPGSFVARMASKNSCLWCHADYLSLFKEDKEKMEEFFDELHYEKFSKIVFVSKIAVENFKKVFPELKNVYYCNNLIDYQKIYEQTREIIELRYSKKQVTFLNVGRHDEDQKKLSRIIKAAARLKEDKYNFRIIFIGDGKDTEKYKRLVRVYNLGENIIFEGAKVNPYPYYKISDCVVISSDYEGYPVVFLESFILNKPIITTNISDYKDVQQGRGIVVQKTVNEIYLAMKRFIEEGFKITKSFNVVKYNEEVKEQLKEIIN